MHKWFWIIGWFPTTLGVAGNAIVIWLIATRRRLRTTANWFVMSLAVADLCIGLFLFPMLFTCKKQWFSCTAQNEHIISTWLSFFVHASAANLCAMTTDRYIAIAMPLKYITYMTPKRSMRLIAAAWVFPAVLWILYTALILHFAASTTVVALEILIKCALEILPAALLTTATIHMLVIVRRHKKEISTLLADLRYNRHTSEDSPTELQDVFGDSYWSGRTRVRSLLLRRLLFLFLPNLSVDFGRRCFTVPVDKRRCKPPRVRAFKERH